MPDLTKPTEHEAPLVAILNVDIDKLTEEQLIEHVDKIRQLRAVPAKRTAAVKKSTNNAKSNDSFNIDSLL
jgi:hypothetical protein